MNRSQHEKTVSMAVIAIIAALAVSGLALVTVTIPLQQEAAMAQPQDNTTTTTTTTTATQSIMPASSNKTFYIFSAEIGEGFNETAARIPGDIYSLPVIEVNKGDSVTVHFYNTEEKEQGVPEERHAFKIDAQPYSVNIDNAPGESGNATFTADQEGVFPYYCIYHLPTMTGELVVLPPSSSQAASSPPAI
jgi:plastocyanin